MDWKILRNTANGHLHLFSANHTRIKRDKKKKIEGWREINSHKYLQQAASVV